MNCNLTHMFVQLFRDSLNEYAYAADLAGLKWELTSTKYGLIVRKEQLNTFRSTLCVIYAYILLRRV